MDIDADSEELVDAFCEEASGIFDQILAIAEGIESGTKPATEFETFAIKIDSVMGCAKTLGLEALGELIPFFYAISQIGEGSKALGYKAFQLKDPVATKMVAGFLCEAAEMSIQALEGLKKGELNFDHEDVRRIAERVKWLAGRLKLTAEEEQSILKKFGM